MTEDNIRSLLREMRDEPVPAGSLARVRLAIAERSRSQTRISWFAWDWKRAGALATIVAVALVAALFRPVPHSIPSQVGVRKEAVALPRPEAPIIEAARRKASVKATPRTIQRLPRAKRANDNGLLVRIETADPEVVILLVGD